MTTPDLDDRLSRPAPAGPSSRRPELPHGPGSWVIAAAFLAVMAFSTVPTPLYAIYQARDGFPAFVVTVVFAAYAVGVVASLFLAGHVSDWLGRRRILLASILVEVLAAIVFLLWPEVPGLLVARLLTGLGVGALTATATAHLSELRAVARPEEGPGTSRAVSTLVNMGGLALGPLVGGVLAVTVDRPLVVPYEVFLVLLVVLGVGVALVPETVERREVLPAYRPQRLAVPAESRGAFLSAAVGAFAGFAVFGLFTSLAPTFLAGRFGETSHLVAGAVSFGVFAAGAVAQLVSARLAARPALLLSASALAVGLVLVAVGAVTAVLWPFVAGGSAGGRRSGAAVPPVPRGRRLARLRRGPRRGAGRHVPGRVPRPRGPRPRDRSGPRAPARRARPPGLRRRRAAAGPRGDRADAPLLARLIEHRHRACARASRPVAARVTMGA
ncbi:MFS transporter [Rathayibacter sp. VKM Ac-2630]|uniref:MFS transporter n=1 Tax=Rathayibacter sp. VKM Ac-2630 TaxID=1938617 RepID=UPI001F00A491|nr:MFS transporter [Rathayibacter sp. VKM Ac-2630]